MLANRMYVHTRKIRDFIGEPRNRQILMADSAVWLQLCSSLDVIEDAELAVKAYAAGTLKPADGAKYLAVYGLLQALFLQQDALFNMCESLSIPERIKDHPKLLEIREIRNNSTGHPTKRGRSTPTSYHFISRATLTQQGFQLLSTDAGGRREFSYICLPELIKEQHLYVDEILEAAALELDARERSHREKFRMDKLVSAFPRTLTYQFEKLFASTRGEEPIALGLWSIEEIQKMLEVFSARLNARGIALETCDPIKAIYETLDYPLSELRKFLKARTSGTEANINPTTAYIFSFFVEARVRELTRIAEEIDEDYAR